MYFETLSVKNFGPLSDLHLSFVPTGINTIFGANASGKTQLVGAIYFALFGENCDVEYFMERATDTPSIVELSIIDNEYKQTINNTVSLVEENGLQKLRLDRTVYFATKPNTSLYASGQKSLMLNIQLQNLLDIEDGPVFVPSWENWHDPRLISPQLDLITQLEIDDDQLLDFVGNLKDLIKNNISRLPRILSEGQIFLLALLQELSRRVKASYSIPLILDGHLSLFGRDSMPIVLRILKKISERDQVIILSPHLEIFGILEDEDLKTYYVLPEPNFTNPHRSLVSYAYYGKKLEQQRHQPILIVTEGKTDWKHLKAALHKLKARGWYDSLNVEFQENEDDPSGGSAELKNLCIYYSKLPTERKTICIFDRDEPSILKQVTGKDKPYKDWGNQVFSFALPEVTHRPNLPDICIELYYKDEEIKRRDSAGRRLYLSEEFSKKSGRSKMDSRLTYPYPNRLSKSNLSIIDSEVYDEKDKNVALSKNQFAANVLNREDNFNDFSVEAFEAVFDIIAEIVTL